MPRFSSSTRRVFSGKHRFAFTALLFFFGILLVLYAAWVLKMLSYNPDKIPHTGTGDWPVRFSELKPGERILIDFQSSGCRSFRRHLLVFNGAVPDVVVTRMSGWSSGSGDEDIPKVGRFVGGQDLTAQELAGLDRFLDLIRNNKQFGSTLLDTIRMQRFVGDVLVASEQFCDDSGMEYAWEEDDKGRIVFSDRDYGRIPGSHEMVSLGMILRRIEKQAAQEANKGTAPL